MYFSVAKKVPFINDSLSYVHYAVFANAPVSLLPAGDIVYAHTPIFGNTEAVSSTIEQAIVLLLF